MGGLQHKEEGKVVVSHFQVHLIYAQDLLNKNPEIHQFFTYGSDRTNYGSDSRLSCTPSLPLQRLHLSVAADTPTPSPSPACSTASNITLSHSFGLRDHFQKHSNAGADGRQGEKGLNG